MDKTPLQVPTSSSTAILGARPHPISDLRWWLLLCCCCCCCCGCCNVRILGPANVPTQNSLQDRIGCLDLDLADVHLSETGNNYPLLAAGGDQLEGAGTK